MSKFILVDQGRLPKNAIYHSESTMLVHTFRPFFGTPTGRLDGFIICTAVYYVSYFNSFRNLSTEKKN